MGKRDDDHRWPSAEDDKKWLSADDEHKWPSAWLKREAPALVVKNASREPLAEFLKDREFSVAEIEAMPENPGIILVVLNSHADLAPVAKAIKSRFTAAEVTKF
ncbi:hypothetical protein [Streptomyces sp. NPDC095602]|uniref:hypothetical protein n=1 Tax=Streptomyces sp. NPDC095602 TaxID=3155819 RepID=UPI003317B617